MKKLPFLTNERASRLMTSLLLCMGLLLPLMMTFGAGSAMAQAVVTACVSLALLLVLGAGNRGRLILGAVAALAAGLQFLLPGFGFFGRSFEALKAIALYLNEVPGAAAMYAGDLALMFGVLLAAISYAFTSRNAGFLPAAMVVVLALFGMWSLGQSAYLWYAAPALAALLLLISQTSHEKVNLFEVLPMAAVVVAVGLLLTPSGQTVIEPLHKAAMQLKQTITDYLFFTEPRNVFTLGSYGYYPMGSGKLGGAASPSDTPVMTVKTDRKALLRAVARDEYTGRSWRDTSSARRYLYVNPRWSALRDSVFQESLPPASVRNASRLLDQYAVSVQMQDTAASTVFTPVFLRRLSAQGDMVAYFNEASELFITRDLQRGDRYTVFAPLIQGGDSALGSLIQAAPRGADAWYEDALNRYTALPDHLEQKVFDDLYNIVANAQTPYDRACAIQRHLQRYYRYTLEPDTPPENQDFVTYFLYVGKEGYCTYFASAMTVLCRMAGLPARYVEGFLAKPGADGFAYVTGENAHAWTEVYFEGFGWVPFDATPSQDEQDEPPQNDPPPEPTPTPTPTPPPEEPENDEPTPTPEPPEEEPQDEPEDEPEQPEKPDFPWWILLVLAAAAAVAVRMAMRAPDRVAARADGDLNRIFVYGNAAFALLLIRKRTPRPGETPLAFARRMDRQKALPVSIAPLWRLMAMSNYSPAQPGPEQTAQAKTVFHRLYRSQRLLTRLRFRLWAAFGKGCYTCLDTQLRHEEIVPKYSYAEQQTRKNAGKKQKKNVRKSDDAYKPGPDWQRPAMPAQEPEPPAAPAEAASARRRRSTRSTEEE
ncbi:MAG: transglutaminase domain-containing protein [Clostridia bacterium]|nr:transglutaminase domain-containing protein [Clostridia bacterium]